MLIHLYTVYGYFYTTRAELRNLQTGGPQSLKYLLPVPLKKSLPISAVDNTNLNLTAS